MLDPVGRMQPNSFIDVGRNMSQLWCENLIKIKWLKVGRKSCKRGKFQLNVNYCARKRRKAYRWDFLID